MTGLVRKATLFAVCALVIAGAAIAGLPDPSTSTVSPIIVLRPTATADGEAVVTVPSPETQVVVMDNVPSPLIGYTVTYHFGNCYANEIRLSDPQPFHPDPANPTGAFSCLNRTVSAVTDGAGIAHFRIVGRTTLGASPGPPPEAGAPNDCAFVTAKGPNPGDIEVLLRNVTVAVADLRIGNLGVDGQDFSYFTAVRFPDSSPSTNYQARCNFAFPGGIFNTVSGADYAVWASYRFYLGGVGTTTNNPPCP